MNKLLQSLAVSFGLVMIILLSFGMGYALFHLPIWVSLIVLFLGLWITVHNGLDE